MTQTQEKAEALQQIAQLAQAHDLSLDEIGATLTQEALKSKSGGWLSILLGYVGAAFIFGGLGLLISVIWSDLNSASRVIITFGPGIVAYILAIISLSDPRFQKASTPLFLKAAILQPVGMFVFLGEYAHGDDKQLAAMIVFGLLAVQFMSTFKSYQRTSLLFFGYLFFNAAVGIFMDRAGVPGDVLGIGLGLSIMMVAWSIDSSPHRPIAAFWYFMGSVGFLWAVFDIIEKTPFDLLYLPITILIMLMSVRIKSRTLLLVGTFALLGFLGYFTKQYFTDMVGWPVALMIMGAFLVGASAYALRLGRTISGVKA